MCVEIIEKEKIIFQNGTDAQPPHPYIKYNKLVLTFSII